MARLPRVVDEGAEGVEVGCAADQVRVVVGRALDQVEALRSGRRVEQPPCMVCRDQVVPVSVDE